MPTLIYKIKVLTNLHAGSGDSGYGIVDKLVQRDAATLLPTIYSSGIKGALKEYFKFLNKTWLTALFGDEENDTGGAQPGFFRFLSADILALPIPKDTSPYYSLVFDQQHINGLQENKYKKLVDGFTIVSSNYSNNPQAFSTACKELPVIARNHLENGQSKNLWYEEVVPHQAEFITAIQYPLVNADVNDFTASLNNAIVQLGGNATVGYGLCSFIQLNP